MTRMTMLTTALALLIAGTAQAAGPGEVLLTGGLPLPPGAIAGGDAGFVADGAAPQGLSQDGRYVAFAADADALSAEANPDVTNIFRKDRQTGAVVLVSRASGPNGAVPTRYSGEPTISDDGRLVAWVTEAAVDPADTDDLDDVYVRDVDTDTTLLASPGTADDVDSYDLSGDGAYVAFTTTTAFAGVNDANGVSDVYRRNLTSGSMVLVSRQAGSALAGNAASRDPSISDDGRWVSYTSNATNLVGAGYVDGPANDVFARDVTAGAGYLVSSRFGTTLTGANSSSNDPQIAGTPVVPADVYVAYNSDATDVAAPGTDDSAAESVYRRRLSVAASALVSRADGPGANADSRAHVGGISDSGARVSFASDADNLTPGAVYYGAYVRDLVAGSTILASVDTAYSVEPMISGDGSFVSWINGSGGITPDSDPELVGVFARAYPHGPPEYVSRPPGTAPFLAPATAVQFSDGGERAISADGRYVVFAASSPRLPSGTIDVTQVYRRDLRSGATELVSRATGPAGAPADRFTGSPSISADGTRVAFQSFAALEPEHVDTTKAAVYVRDLAAATTTLVSRADGAGGALPDMSAGLPHISAGGGHVAFTTTAANLGAPGGVAHAYLRNLAARSTQLVDRATGADGAIGNGDVSGLSVSGDGRLVALATRANNVDPADPAPDVLRHVYVRDTVAQTTTLVSRRSGSDGPRADGSALEPALSADGRVIAFRASDEALAPEAGTWGGEDQIVARDLATAQNTLVSRAGSGAPADSDASDASVSGDGSVIAFSSAATNLVGGVGGGSRHGVFARNMATGALNGPPAFGLIDNEPQNRAQSPSLSDDGQCLAFQAIGHNAFTGAEGNIRTAYVYVVSGACPKPVPADPLPAPPAAEPKPAITDASLLRKRFRVGKRATAKQALATRRARAGTAFRFGLSTAADVTIALQRRAAGRRVGKTCRKPTRRLRNRPACVRFVKRGLLTRGGLAAGRRRVAFSGRVGRRALRPGRYRAVLRASNAAGTSAPVRLAFRIVRR